MQSHAASSAAMPSLHAVRGMISLRDFAASELWLRLEAGLRSRLGSRSYAAQPHFNYHQHGVNHEYDKPAHVPRRWNPQPAADGRGMEAQQQALEEQHYRNTREPHLQWKPAQRSRADMGAVKRPPETASGRLMRERLQKVTQSQPQAFGSDAAPAVSSTINPHAASGRDDQPRNVAAQVDRRRRERMWKVNAQQRDVLPNGVPSNYKPFVPPPRDAFRSVVNDRGKLPNRHPKHAAHGGTYTAIPQEASKPFRDGGRQAGASLPIEYQQMPPSGGFYDHFDGSRPDMGGGEVRLDGQSGYDLPPGPNYSGPKTHSVPEHLSSIGLPLRYRPRAFRAAAADDTDARQDMARHSDSERTTPWYQTGRPRPPELLQPQRSGAAYGAQQHILGGQQHPQYINGVPGRDHMPPRPPSNGRVWDSVVSPRQSNQFQRPPPFQQPMPSQRPQAPHRPHPPPPPREPVAINLPDDVTVKELASKLGVTVSRLEEVLQEVGDAPTSQEDLVLPDTAELAAMELDRIVVFSPDVHRKDADAEPRSAVVTVMGHVDHGKTSLLDALRSTSVAAGEAGGITQHIGAFTVAMPGSKQALTFLDTPGHAAFTSMRARGAAVTDLVVLVVAAEDGVMPQTKEALAHAKAAGCPIVVALTKCDLPNARPEEVEQQLLSEGVELESAGGTVQLVRTAAPSGVGLLQLEEALLLQAEMMELEASRSRNAEAVVVEARLVVGQGSVATIIAKRGVLRIGQPVVVGCEWGKVRALKAPGGAAVKEVLPGQPAEISGLRGMPQAGDSLMAVASEERAQRMSRARTMKADAYRHARNATANAAQLAADEAADQAAADGTTEALDRRQLSVVIKGDVQGSVEAVTDAINRLSSDKVRVKVLFGGVGAVSHSDVQLAISTGATILAFNVRSPPAAVEQEAKIKGVSICSQRIIYRLLEEVGDLMAGSAARVDQEIQQGEANVLQVFAMKGARGEPGPSVAGLRVTDGSLRANMLFRVLRGAEVVHEGKCDSLKRLKQTVDTVGKGTECGIMLQGFDDCQAGDRVVCYTVENRAAKSSEVVKQPANP